MEEEEWNKMWPKIASIFPQSVTFTLQSVTLTENCHEIRLKWQFCSKSEAKPLIGRNCSSFRFLLGSVEAKSLIWSKHLICLHFAKFFLGAEPSLHTRPHNQHAISIHKSHFLGAKSHLAMTFRCWAPEARHLTPEFSRFESSHRRLQEFSLNSTTFHFHVHLFPASVDFLSAALLIPCNVRD